MKQLLLCIMFACSIVAVTAQNSKTELYDLIKKLLPDSTGYENVGDWAVGLPKKFPVKWKEDRLIMSEDTSINFYRTGTADVTINGKTFMQSGLPVKWSVMLKGPRMGYTSFSIITAPLSNDVPGKSNIDSIFSKRVFKATLLKTCDTKPVAGFYYYQLKLPKKDMAFIKISWVTANGSSALRIDCFDTYSQYAAKIDCPK